MAFWKKIAFWKHEPELEEFSPELAPGVGEQGEQSTAMPPKKFSPLSEQGLEPSFAQSPFQAQTLGAMHALPQQSLNSDAELRVITAKLDTIKALLDVINQRLDKLEGRKGDELGRWR